MTNQTRVRTCPQRVQSPPHLNSGRPSWQNWRAQSPLLKRRALWQKRRSPVGSRSAHVRRHRWYPVHQPFRVVANLQLRRSSRRRWHRFNPTATATLACTEYGRTYCTVPACTVSKLASYLLVECLCTVVFLGSYCLDNVDILWTQLVSLVKPEGRPPPPRPN